MTAWTTPVAVTTTDTLTAAKWNTEVVDNTTHVKELANLALLSLDNTTGEIQGDHTTQQLYFQAGTVVFTAIAGGREVAFPTPFPVGLLSVVVCGDPSGTGVFYIKEDDSNSTEMVIRVYDLETGAEMTSGSWRVQYIAIGW